MHQALGMGLSYTCHGAFCTENEVYHFDNVFFKIGEDEARLMSPSQRVLLETGCEALQRSGSSELPTESLSKRSTHQFPRLLNSLSMSTFATCGTTTAEGLYANSFFELNHYAIGGVRAQALSVLVLSTSTTGSSRRVPPPRGSRLAVPARDTPFVFLELARWLRTRRFHAKWIRCRRPASGTGPLSLRLCLRLHFCRRLYAVGTCSRASGRVSRARSTTEFGHRNSFVFLTESLIHGDPVNRGVRTSFPGRDRVQFDLSGSKAAQLRCASPSRSATARSRCPRSFGPEASFTEWLGRISHRIWVEITCPAFLGVPLCPT